MPTAFSGCRLAAPTLPLRDHSARVPRLRPAHTLSRAARLTGEALLTERAHLGSVRTAERQTPPRCAALPTVVTHARAPQRLARPTAAAGADAAACSPLAPLSAASMEMFLELAHASLPTVPLDKGVVQANTGVLLMDSLPLLTMWPMTRVRRLESAAGGPPAVAASAPTWPPVLPACASPCPSADPGPLFDACPRLSRLRSLHTALGTAQHPTTRAPALPHLPAPRVLPVGHRRPSACSGSEGGTSTFRCSSWAGCWP